MTVMESAIHFQPTT